MNSRHCWHPSSKLKIHGYKEWILYFVIILNGLHQRHSYFALLLTFLQSCPGSCIYQEVVPPRMIENKHSTLNPPSRRKSELTHTPNGPPPPTEHLKTFDSSQWPKTKPSRRRSGSLNVKIVRRPLLKLSPSEIWWDVFVMKSFS